MDDDDDLFRPGPREVVVQHLSDSSSSDDEGDEERRETRIRSVLKASEVPTEYWQIQKLVKYMKTGNQTATVVALCCLRDQDLTTFVSHQAIADIGGLEVLVNLLETKDIKCKVGSLGVLRIITGNAEVARQIIALGAVPLLLKNLCEPARDIQITATETLANLCQMRKARTIVRLSEGIPKVVDLLDVSSAALATQRDALSEEERELVDTAKAAARALWALAKSRKNIDHMKRSGVVSLLAKLLKSVHKDVIVAAVGTIYQCSNEPSYQLAYQTEGMIRDIVKHVQVQGEPELRRYCAAAIFKCAQDPVTSDMVRQSGGLDPLVEMARDEEMREDKPLLAAVTGAIWKCAVSDKNLERFDQLSIVEVLVDLLEDESEEVLANVTGALSACLKYSSNRDKLRRAGGIPKLVNLLNYTYCPLLENVPLVLRECANDPEAMAIIEDPETLDGVRLIWSLLKNPSARVQENAAWALVPCVRFAHDSGEMVRSFVGGLELIVSLLKSKDEGVLAAVCAAIAIIAQDKENLAVITDHGVLPALVNLIRTRNPLLREHLADAIAYCCDWSVNCKEMGRQGAITPLVAYMVEDNKDVIRATTLALNFLSKNAFNCITMHESGVVPFLLKAVTSDDPPTQEAAAGCLSNIRRLAFEAETAHLLRKTDAQSDDDDDDDDDYDAN